MSQSEMNFFQNMYGKWVLTNLSQNYRLKVIDLSQGCVPRAAMCHAPLAKVDNFKSVILGQIGQYLENEVGKLSCLIGAFIQESSSGDVECFVCSNPKANWFRVRYCFFQKIKSQIS